MSKFSLAKASAILTGLSLLAASAYPVLAVKAPVSAITALRNQAASRSSAVSQRLEVRKQNIEAKLTAIKERIASKEASLKVKLQTFKDQNKAKIAERVSATLNKINENQTTQMDKHLERMSDILKKLEGRVNSGTPDIKNPDAAREAIASASAAIATASEAVFLQAEKDYTIQVSTESRIKEDAKNQRDKLHNDLTSTRKLVRDAKKAVANAIRVAKNASPLENKEATESGQ